MIEKNHRTFDEELNSSEILFSSVTVAPSSFSSLPLHALFDYDLQCLLFGVRARYNEAINAFCTDPVQFGGCSMRCSRDDSDKELVGVSTGWSLR